MNSNTTITFLDNFCRTCMNGEIKDEEKSDQRKTISIFNAPESLECNNLTIMELLLLTTPQLTIESEDMLPKILCENCVDRLINVYEFQQMCIRVEEKYRQTIKEQKPDSFQIIPDPFDNAAVNQAIILKIEMEEPLIDHNELIFDEKNLTEITKDLKHETKDNQWKNYRESDEFYDVDREKDNKWKPSSKTVKRKKSKKTAAKKLKKEESTTSSNLINFEENVDQKDEDPSKESKEVEKVIEITIDAKVNGSKQFTCDECGKRLASRKTLRQHKRTHLAAAPKFVCEVCKRGFHLSNALKRHIRTHTGEQPYLCSVCGKTFGSASTMRQHFLTHDSDRRYACQHCPKKFFSVSNLASHQVVHSKKRSIVCDVCGASFAQPHQLKNHKKYHTGEKNFKCDFCDTRFFSAESCRRHMRTHTGEKPYKCKYCERAFAQSNDLIKHMRGHIGDNVYKCNLCPQGFRLQRDLRVHFYTHKDDDEETRARNLQALKDEEQNLQIKFGLVKTT